MPHELEHDSHLSVEQLAAHLERRLRGADRELVVAHLVECAECRRDYVDAGVVLGVAHARWPVLTTSTLVRAGLGLAVAAVIVLAFVPRSFAPHDSESGDASTQRIGVADAAPPIRLASPADGSRLTGNEVVLAWHPDGADALYRVTVQTADGTVIWRKNTNDTTVTLQAGTQIAAGGMYYWIVDALHADGRSARSAANAFRR